VPGSGWHGRLLFGMLEHWIVNETLDCILCMSCAWFACNAFNKEELKTGVFETGFATYGRVCADLVKS